MKQRIATQTGLSSLRKVNANMRVLMGNIATLAEALKLYWHCARVLELLVGEAGGEEQENSQIICSSLLSS